MSLAHLEIVMDGNKPIRTILIPKDGEPIELAGVHDVSVGMQNEGPVEVALKIYADVTVRPALPGEL